MDRDEDVARESAHRPFVAESLLLPSGSEAVERADARAQVPSSGAKGGRASRPCTRRFDAESIVSGWARLLRQRIAEAQGRVTAKVGEGSFDEDRFFEPRPRCCGLSALLCLGRGRRRASPHGVRLVLRRLLESQFLPSELFVLSAIYIERLLCRTTMHVSPKNWLPLVVTALLVASKVWEDMHPWNIDYAHILREVIGLRLRRPNGLYHLEAEFLECLQWDMCVSSEEFAKFCVALSTEDVEAKLDISRSGSEGRRSAATAAEPLLEEASPQQ